MKKQILGLLAVLLAFTVHAGYVIVVSPDAIPAERNAALELQKHLGMLGKDFNIPIVSEPAAGKRSIFVGRQVRETLKPDEIILSGSNGDLILTGDRPRGTLYAVYTYLEEYLGFRFWTASETHVPKTALKELPVPNLRYAPVFYYRDTNYIEAQRIPSLAVKFKLNGHFNPIPPELGGHLTFGGMVHTFDLFIPAARYYAAHPEWFSLRGKQRVGGGQTGQLCLTNPDMRREFVKNCRAMLAKDPTIKILSVSQNDNMFYCECPSCAAIDAREESHSGSLIDFVNYVADALRQEFPQVQFETLAYQYSRKPPRHLRPSPNVMIRLCPIEADYSHPLNSDANADFRDDLLRWKEIAPQLAIWNYVTNFTCYLHPHPNMSSWGEDTRFFAENRVRAVFNQAETTKIGPWVDMRAWIIGKLLWNPYQDMNQLIDTFLKGYYGAAAPILRRQYDLLDATLAKSGKKLPCMPKGGTSAWLPLETLLKLREMHQEALHTVKDDPVLTERLERLGVCYDFDLLERSNEEVEGKVSLEERRRTFDRVKAVVDRTATIVCAEVVPIESSLKQIQYRLGNYRIKHSGKIPEFCRNLPVDRWMELPAQEMWLFEPGKLTERKPDASAASGESIRLSCHAYVWMVQCWVPATWDGRRGRLYAALNGKNLPVNGDALQIGLYDRVTKKDVVHIIKSAQIKEKDYHLVDAGTFDFTKNQTIYLAPVVPASNPGFVWIDRFICVLEPADSPEKTGK